VRRSNDAWMLPKRFLLHAKAYNVSDHIILLTVASQQETDEYPAFFQLRHTFTNGERQACPTTVITPRFWRRWRIWEHLGSRMQSWRRLLEGPHHGDGNGAFSMGS